MLPIGATRICADREECSMADTYSGPIPLSRSDATIWSVAAIRWARRRLSNGNSNPWPDIPGSSLRGSNQAIMTEEVLAKRAFPNNEDRQATPDLFRRTLNDAKIASAFKCGNCDE